MLAWPAAVYVRPAALPVPRGPRPIHAIECGFGLDASAVSPELQSVPQPYAAGTCSEDCTSAPAAGLSTAP